MQKEKILVIKGISQYNVLRYATDILCNEWINMGYEVYVIDLCVEDDLNNIHNTINNNCKMIFSAQCLLFDNQIINNFFKNLQCKYIGWIFDHPIYHKNRINSARDQKDLIITSIDKGHVKYIKENYGIKESVNYLPHGGFMAKNKVEYPQKNIEVFSPGGYINSEDILVKIQELPETFAHVANKVISYLIDDSNLSPVDALYKYFNNINFLYTNEDIIELEIIIQLIDKYIRAYYREVVIKKLIDSGIKVSVTGVGWKMFYTKNKENITVISENGLDITEVTELISNSKICLNIAPTLTRGMHERLLTAMLNRAICVTPFNEYLNEIFKDGDSLLYVKMSNIDSVIHKIKYILKHDELGVQISDKAYALTADRHTWESRAHDLINLV